ncbi:MAG: filamentous hemagglutinin family N-terminal domain protein [Hydrocarboniphaga sp.]|uniref:beta strand repeat-containing protein n=1 Tax=Hydrocarboniphaga sp. TaxID=2033016 RepID=UPI002628E6E9|nr:MBG domain-containing protein [Hydrocarboniphaga sp.]MDB5968207.1 filamentous hemagglutinin family N-terminal domain protein [Hydrocarboniphaga sp.]
MNPLFHPRRTAIATAVAMLASPGLQAGTLPTGGVVASGGATISQNAATTAMTVNQSTQSAIINWTGFSIGAGDSVQFVQPNTTAVALNRVTGGQASNIAGNLSANGRVFLVNPSGVVFASGSQVNVGGLVASTLGISDADFNAGVASGQFVFSGAVDVNAAVTSSGTITAANGGTVALLGNAANTASGIITADGGSIAIGNGPSVTLDFQGDGLTQLTVSGTPAFQPAGVANAGTLQADGGRVVMRGASRLDASDLVVNQSGTIRARSLQSRGGQIILSGGDEGAVDVSGALDASSIAATAAGGSIAIDGQRVSIQDTATLNASGSGGAASGTVDIASEASVVVAYAPDAPEDSYISVAAVNSALDGAQNTRIASTAGQINIGDDVALVRSLGDERASLTFEAARAFFGGVDPTGAAVPWSVNSTAGALDLNVNAQSSVVINEASIQTNGGDVSLTSVNSNTAALDITDTIIDTRIAQNAANASGSVALSGTGADAGVRIGNSQVLTSSGAILIDGRTSAVASPYAAPGVVIAAGNAGSLISSGSGDITITGIGRDGDNGVTVLDSIVSSLSGSVDVAGRGETAGVQLLQNTGFETRIDGGSGVLLTGTATGAGPGIAVDSAASVNSAAGSVALRAETAVAGGAPVTVGFNAAVTAASTIDLRPGGLAADGTRFDSSASNIILGSGSSGFVVGDALLDTLDAPNLVVGSDTHSGNIQVQSAITLARNLTLQNSSGGITLNQSVDVGTKVLALSSAGDIRQNGGGITARSLLAQSSAGSVILDSTANAVSTNTLAGSAAGDFSYVNANAIGVGTVNANGYASGTNAPTALSATGIAAGGDVLVQTLAGDLILNAAISGANVDLVTAGVFDNAGSAPVTASGAAHIYAPNFSGENRGGLAGGNRYNCSFGGSCTAGLPASGVTYVYTYQPTLNIDIADAIREYGLANPALLFALTGLVNGDTQATALSGGPTTAATTGSNVGNYAILGGFTSLQGYALNIAPGVLAITPALLSYVASTSSREYGLANPLFGGTVTGFRNGDTIASATTGTLAFTSPATTGSNVGNYAINGSGLSAGNYRFAQAAGNATALQIIQATLSYVANGISREYGLANPALGGSVTGFRNGDTLGSATTGTLAFTTAATIGSNVGSYAINGSGLSAGNYRFVQAAGNAGALQIIQATLSYVANGISREYGLDNPALTGTVTGFRNNDTIASATSGTLGFTTPANIGSNVGDYAITGSGLNAGNYRFVQSAGNASAFQITRATLLYVADPATRGLGSPNPELSGSVTGLRNGDTLASATDGSAVFATNADASSPIGSYAITGSGLSAQNYVLAQAPGNAASLSVVPVIALPAVAEVITLPETDVYGNNFGPMAAICATSLSDPGAVGGGSDPLAHDWSLLRSKPNLTSCVDTQKKNSCSAGF